MEFPSHLEAPLFHLPSDIFQTILDYLSKRDVLCLSLTCRSLKKAPIVLKAVYTELFDRDDLPLGGYKEYVIVHKPMFDTLLSGITTGGGAFVRRVSVHEWFTKANISLLLKHCPKLDTIDFTGITEGVDYKRHVGQFRPVIDPLCACRQKSSGKELCLPCQEQFEWYDVISNCPELFRNRHSFELTLLNGYNVDPRLENSYLSQILSLASSLQNLSLRFSPNGYRYAFPGIRDTADEEEELTVTPKPLQQSILMGGCKTLKTLELHGLRIMIPCLKSFLQPLARLPNLKNIVLSLHQDMILYTPSWHAFYHNCDLQMDRPRWRYLVVEYVAMLRSITECQRWNLVCADSGGSYPIGPRALYGFLEEDNMELLCWLRTHLNWTPVFLWSDYIYVQKACDEKHLKILELHMEKCRKLFKLLKFMKVPIRLIIPPVWQGAIFTYILKSQYPGDRYTYDCDKEIPDISHWRLNSIGDLVDELSLRWDYEFGNIFTNVTTTSESLAERLKRTEPFLQKRILRELRNFRFFCQTIAANFPNLTRLALFIPAALFPNLPTRNNDADFAANFLPGTAWRAQHHGSGGAMPYPKTEYEHKFGQGHSMRHGRLSNCVVYDSPPWDLGDRVHKEFQLASKTRCPMIHRVFTRELPAS